MRSIYLLKIFTDTEIYYKIGIATDVEKRIQQLQTGSAFLIELCKQYESTKYPFKIEKYLHNYFSDKKVMNEWFSLESEDVRGFIALCEKAESNFEFLENNNTYLKKEFFK